MINMEDWVTIRNLKKRQPELGTRRIAHMLGVSRNTVKRALMTETHPTYSRKEYVSPELEPFVEYVKVQYCTKKLRGSRILEDLRSKGCTISKTAFYLHLKKLGELSTQAFMRYETKPGEQAQFDWSPYTIMIAGMLVKIQIYTLILGFSRYRIYFPSLSQNQSSVLEAMEYCFHQFGGITVRVQTDNHKTLIDNASVRDFKWNQRYLNFAEHYGFSPSRSMPGRPNSKGKVENPFFFLETHFIMDSEFSSFEDFFEKLREFQDSVNNRIHQTTRVEPAKLFNEIEKDMLMPLPLGKYIGSREEFRKVSSDCLISYGGNRYSVPYVFAGKEVWVRASQGIHLNVYSQTNSLVATHILERKEKGRIFINERHFKGYRGKKGSWDRLCSLFLDRCPGHEDFLSKLQAQKRICPSRHLTKIVEVITYFGSNDVDKVIALCHKYNIYHSDLFIELLYKVATPIPVHEMKDTVDVHFQTPPGVVRTLDSYRIDYFGGGGR
jgi:transposase